MSKIKKNLKEWCIENNRLDLLDEWDYENNGEMTPNDVNTFSHNKVWWKCQNNHNWQATISNRTNGNSCPYCSNHRLLKGFNSLADIYPDIADSSKP